jgi:hypothetical protein
MLKDLEDRCDAIEECYEYMLAYAAQGLNGDEGSASGGQLKHFLIRAVDAMSGLADAWSSAIKNEGLQPAVRYDAFLKVLERDANDSLATAELVLAQPFISSQLIDNLNASIHLRALLTDLFLVDEIVKTHLKVALRVNSPDSLLESVPSDDN